MRDKIKQTNVFGGNQINRENKFITKHRKQGLFVGFILGIVTSIIASIVFETLIKPNL